MARTRKLRSRIYGVLVGTGIAPEDATELAKEAVDSWNSRMYETFYKKIAAAYGDILAAADLTPDKIRALSFGTARATLIGALYQVAKFTKPGVFGGRKLPPVPPEAAARAVWLVRGDLQALVTEEEFIRIVTAMHARI